MNDTKEILDLLDLYRDLNNFCRDKLTRNFDEILLFLMENEKLCDDETKKQVYQCYTRLVTILKVMSLGSMEVASRLHKE